MNEYPNDPQQNGGNPNNEQPQVAKSYTPSSISQVKNMSNKAYNAAKKAGQVAKKAFKVIGNFVRTSVKIIASHPIAFAIIVGILFLVIIIMMIINDWRSEFTAKSVENGSTEIIESWDENNLSDQQKLAKNSYEKTGSILDFSTNNIEEMKNKLEEDKNNTKSYIEEYDVYEALLSEKGSNSLLATQRIVSPDDKVSLYQHMLSISKYDFNNVKWKRYGHGIDGEDSPLKEDLEQGVRYPTDQNNTEYETFSSLLRPYLLSYEVPMSFFSGLISDSKQTLDSSVDMTYAIIKYGLSDITVNRYDLQKYNLLTYYRDYDWTQYYSSFNVKFTPQSDGTYQISCYGITENPTSSGHKNTMQDENGNSDVMLEKKIEEGSYITYDNKYYIANANIFDLKLINTYEYTPYSQSDVDNRVYADSTDVTEEYYEAIENEQNRIVNVNIPAGSCTSAEIEGILSSIDSSNGVTHGGGATGGDNSITYTFTGNTYEKRVGTTFYVNRVWEDRLSQKERKEEFYGLSDVIEYNKTCSAGNISEEDFNSDEKSLTYYNKLQEREKLNRIDFINSNPNIFKSYMIDTNYAKYVGIYRQELEAFCYYNLTEQWQGLLNDYKSFPYAYGKTYGFNKGYSGNASEYLSGISLLKKYIHSFEGDGSYSGGGRFDENFNKVTDDAKTAYYKVYDAQDNVHTVGYGINMEANAPLLAEYGIDVSTVQYGDFIPKDIVDKVEDSIIQGRIDSITAKTNGIELQEYQLHALVSHSYPAGNINYFVDAYNRHWVEETDNKYEELYEEYKDNQTAVSSIMAEVDFSHGIYNDFFSFYNYRSLNDKYAGYEPRQKSEFTLFSTGYYSTLKMFWTASAGTPGNFVLVNGDTIDDAACLDLQMWFEQNVFSGGLSAGADLYGYKAISANGGADNTDKYGYVNPEYDAMATGSYYYQCPWWSRLRANMYFRDMGSDRILTGKTGDGRDAAGMAADQLGLPLNTSIDGIRPYSIISFSKPGSEHGHTAFVEAVTSEYVILSECSSGKYWNGISIVPKARLTSTSSSYYFTGSVCLTDAL